MPAVALSRAGARVVESGPGGENLTAGTWQRLEALPDPRSPQGRIYPLACLIAIAVCAFTAAGNDRLTPRELQVLRLMAEGRSNSGIGAELKVSPSAVEKYVTNIFAKLDLPPTGTDHRRVLAVLKYLGT